MRSVITLITLFLSVPAFAQEAAPVPAAGGGAESIIMLGAILLIFYFLVFRPQSKKIKEHQRMVEGLKRGDRVVTGGGVFGTISKVNEDGKTVIVKIADSVEVEVLKATVSSTITRAGEAVDSSKPANENLVKAEKKKSKK